MHDGDVFCCVVLISYYHSCCHQITSSISVVCYNFCFEDHAIVFQLFQSDSLDGLKDHSALLSCFLFLFLMAAGEKKLNTPDALPHTVSSLQGVAVVRKR